MGLTLSLIVMQGDDAVAQRYGCLLVLVVLAGGMAGQSGGQTAPVSAKIYRQDRAIGVGAMVAGPTLQCVADAALVAPGQTAVVRAHGMSPTGRSLRYSFTANAGQLVVKGAFVELHTLGLGSRAVEVTCTVTDDVGSSTSKAVVVNVREQQMRSAPGWAMPLPRPGSVSGPPATTVESAHPAPLPAPVPSRSPASTPTPTPTPTTATTATTATGSDAGYQQSKLVEEWKKNLKVGKIEYQVPSQMLMQHASTVTVVIHGFGDTATTTLPNATGSESLKQSERMKVELLAPNNPDEFTIVPQGGTEARFVPIDGATTWMWNVTPNAPAEKQQLLIRASVIYPAADDRTEQQLPDYTAVVEVEVPSTWKMITESYRKDPLKWFSYVIPGGAGFTFLAGVLVWWLKKRKEK
ncbi:MAG TPA: hypothetical protein VK627_01375 [Edaphobacter sp.]|nr:hypothetical protein [Edaphobacter sp.]